MSLKIIGFAGPAITGLGVGIGCWLDSNSLKDNKLPENPDLTASRSLISEIKGEASKTARELSRIEDSAEEIHSLSTDISMINSRLAIVSKQLERGEDAYGTSLVSLKDLKECLSESKRETEKALEANFNGTLPIMVSGIVKAENDLRADLSKISGLNDERREFIINGWYVQLFVNEGSLAGAALSSKELKTLDAIYKDCSPKKHRQINDFGAQIRSMIQRANQYEGPTIGAARHDPFLALECRDLLKSINESNKALDLVIGLITKGKPKGEIPPASILKPLVKNLIVKSLVKDLVTSPLDSKMSYHSMTGKKKFDMIKEKVEQCMENERLARKEAERRSESSKSSGGSSSADQRGRGADRSDPPDRHGGRAGSSGGSGSSSGGSSSSGGDGRRPEVRIDSLGPK